jgi:RNA polymerase sigma factor (sigma-70 family)
VTPPSDADLVARALARDAAGRAAFETLVARHHPMLSRACLRALDGDAALAADATQDAVLQALVGLGSLREPGSFGAWLTGIGLRVARRLGARRRRDEGDDALAVLPSDEPSPEDAAARAATVARVRAAVAALPPGQRDAVFLYYLAGLSRAEVAEHLGTGEGAIRQRLHKARATLRAHLDEGGSSMVTMEIADVRATGEDRFSATHVVVLAEPGRTGDGRTLPIWVDALEATALVATLEAVELPRPGTYAFAASLLDAAGGRVEEVRIARLEGGVFYAEVVLAGGASLDARPSDALNLALIADAPIVVDPAVLEAAGDEPVPGGDVGDGERGAPQLAAALRERLARR